MGIPQATVTEVVAQAVNRLLARDAALFERDVNEQAIAHHLATYIREGLSDAFHVDVEYNRHLNEKKVVLIGERWAVVRPDIVVHERGTDRSNVLAIEVKKFGSDIAHDREKLVALMQQYGYQHAAHVLVGLREGKPVAQVVSIRAMESNAKESP
jgi:hypothetical protein